VTADTALRLARYFKTDLVQCAGRPTTLSKVDSEVHLSGIPSSDRGTSLPEVKSTLAPRRHRRSLQQKALREICGDELCTSVLSGAFWCNGAR
jgi:hypothetical protein